MLLVDSWIVALRGTEYLSLIKKMANFSFFKIVVVNRLVADVIEINMGFFFFFYPFAGLLVIFIFLVEVVEHIMYPVRVC